jgi:transcriptional regulator with XRE-family HTH domain
MRVRRLRDELGLSRGELARFLGVSEATVTRWESSDAPSEPKGLSAVLLRCMLDALMRHSPRDVARIVRSCGVDHRAALQDLLRAGETPSR